MRKGYLALFSRLVVVSLLFGIISCASPTPTPTPTPTPSPAPTPVGPAPATIKIGTSISLTGANASGALEIYRAYQIAVQEINNDGGIFVKAYNKKIPIEHIVLDDESDPLKSASRMETIIGQNNPVAFAGAASSAINVSLAASAEKNKIPYVAVGFTLMSPHLLGYKYLFSPFNKTPQLIPAVWDLLATIPAADRPSKAAVWGSSDDFGLETINTVKSTLPSGYTVVHEAKFAVGSTDFSSLLTAAKAAGADVLFTNPPPQLGFPLWNQAKQLGWAPKFAWVDAAPTTEAWGKTLGADGDYVVTEGPYHWSYKYPGNDRFVNDFKAKFGINPRPVSGTAFVVFQVIAAAIEKAGVLDKEKVRDALAATDMVTVMGPMKFDDKGVGVFPIGFCQWQKGVQEQIWPLNMKTAPLIYPIPPWSQR